MAALSAIWAPAPAPGGGALAPGNHCTVVNKDGATYVAAAGIVAPVDPACPMGGWVDRVVVNALGVGMWAVSCHCLTLSAEGGRDRESGEAVTVVLQKEESSGFRLRHLQRQAIDPESPSLDLAFLE